MGLRWSNSIYFKVDQYGMMYANKATEFKVKFVNESRFRNLIFFTIPRMGCTPR